ncbi:uncharacterized protein [Temnothorax nylanderi]|uniref:uncharacterized protein n=1 Tax=Temnothorax nylanderi TaxID=102681 RepID=UPI003A8BA6A4
MASFSVKFSGGLNSSPIGSPGGAALNDATRNGINLRNNLQIGTWNTRGLLQIGKLLIVEREIQSLKLDIVGLSETHWKGEGHFSTASGNVIYFSGHNSESRNGVALLLSRTTNKSVLGYNIIQVYAPTAESTEEAIETFYEQLENTINDLPRGEIPVVMGDVNANIGRTTVIDQQLKEVLGRFGMGTRNDRGDRMLQFCQEHNLTIANTLFQHHIRRLYTWRSPGDRFRNQIDYIMVGSRWKSSILNCKTYPGADCGTDHQLLVMKFRLRLKNIRQPQKVIAINGANKELFRREVQQKLATNTADIINTQDPNQEWEELKKIIKTASESIQCKNRPNRSNKFWITQRTLVTIEERKELKRKGLKTQTTRDTYKALCRRIQRECRQDKNEYIKEICREIEEHQNSNDTRDLYRKVRELTRKLTPRTAAIEDKSDKILWESNDIVERWRQYCEELYKEDTVAENGEQAIKMTNEREPPILKSEVEEAITHLKPNKAPGLDEVSAEKIKLLGDEGIRIIHDICNKVWQSGQWPKNWAKSAVIPIHKKGSTRKCQNYRTISLISHASKVLLRIIDRRLQQYLSHQIPPEQAGFVKGRGTRDQIFNIRQLIEKAREFNTPMFLCFIDYKKAFDCVRWKDLWKVLREMGVPDHLVTLISNLKKESAAVIKLENKKSKPFKTHKGVRQGCILSPRLFNIYGEYIMRRALEGKSGGIIINGKNLNNLRYADDTTLIAKNEEELTKMLELVTKESNEVGLHINLEKTKLMVIDRGNTIQRNNVRPDMETVNEFIYLGSLISNIGGSEAEIRRRIAMSRTAMANLRRIWEDKQITTNTKIALVRSLVFSIFSYGAETWTIKAADRHRIDAFEMWCWRRMLSIPWSARRTNVSILN